MRVRHDQQGIGVLTGLILLVIAFVVVGIGVAVKHHIKPAATVPAAKPAAFITFANTITAPDKIDSDALAQTQAHMKGMSPVYFTPQGSYIMADSDSIVTWGATAPSAPSTPDAGAFLAEFIRSQNASISISNVRIEKTYSTTVHDVNGKQDAFSCAVASYDSTSLDKQSGQTMTSPEVGITGICLGGNQKTTVMFNDVTADSTTAADQLATFMNASTLNLE